jgi:predicted flap endonuclease-1-like 5' DNA nuclease
MADVTTSNWMIVLILLIVVVLAAWWLLTATRKTRIERGEAPSEETPARRNQALIDAPGSPDADVPPPTPEGIGGVGAAIAAVAAPVHEHPAVPTDDLKQIKGIGPKLEKLLNSLGVTSYAQIAVWDDAEMDRIDARLGTFQGRIRRDDWPAQARLLAAGDRAGFESRFGRL